DIKQQPQTRAQRLAVLLDAADLLAAETSSSDARFGPRELVTDINRLARALVKASDAALRNDDVWHIQALATQLASVAAEFDRAPRDVSGDIPYWCKSVLASAEGITVEEQVPPELLRTLAGRLLALAEGVRFDFLYARRRRIFSIGYRLADAEGAGRLDSSFYDLLASEARLASFVAIAQGDVPQHHWFH